QQLVPTDSTLPGGFQGFQQNPVGGVFRRFLKVGRSYLLELVEPLVFPPLPCTYRSDGIVPDPIVGRVGDAGEESGERECLHPGSPVVVRNRIDPASRLVPAGSLAVWGGSGRRLVGREIGRASCRERVESAREGG